MWCISDLSLPIAGILSHLSGTDSLLDDFQNQRSPNLFPWITLQSPNIHSVLSAFVPPHTVQKMQAEYLSKILLMWFCALVQVYIINSPVQGTVGCVRGFFGFVLVLFSKIAFCEIHTLINVAFLIFAQCILKSGQWGHLAPLFICVGKTSN